MNKLRSTTSPGHDSLYLSQNVNCEHLAPSKYKCTDLTQLDLHYGISAVFGDLYAKKTFVSSTHMIYMSEYQKLILVHRFLIPSLNLNPSFILFSLKQKSYTVLSILAGWLWTY
jgi:hypothetical protein